jgi:hypothetical protein
MGLCGYYWLLLRTALKPTLGKADLISSVAGAILVAVAHLFPKLGPLLTASLWQIPIWVFATVAAVRLICAPFWLWTMDQREIQEQRRQIDLLVAEAEPTLKLFFDETQPFSTVERHPDRPPRLLASVIVENVGGKFLERCQLRIRYRGSGAKQSRLSEIRFVCAFFFGSR